MLDNAKGQGLDLAEVIRSRVLVMFVAITLIMVGLNIATVAADENNKGAISISAFLSPAMKEVLGYLTYAANIAIVLGAAMVGIRL